MKQKNILLRARQTLDVEVRAGTEDNVFEYHLPVSSMRYIILCLAYDDDTNDKFIKFFSFIYFILFASD